MFIVYCGYLGPDHHDSSVKPVYELLTFSKEEEVLKHHEMFKSETADEASHIIYRVFTGQELRIEPVRRVTEYKLVGDDDDE